ncbi:hypothetical protein [Roseateles albus]|uniref:Uncharacterized protein n=1 Tax=Roseateles albus TaxID=2987525 RepID=A0ABT5KP13_9BURK|nr:hypothetical protein [Roseateles albus]MDC8774571.1 hypothetical protein [Roseateles albus]
MDNRAEALQYLASLGGQLAPADGFFAERAISPRTEIEQMFIEARAVLAEIEARNDRGNCTSAERFDHSAIKNLCRSIQERLDMAAEFGEVLGKRLANTRDRLAKASE